MIELAFRVNKRSEFYSRYMKKKAEKEKFSKLMGEFCEKHGIPEGKTFYYSNQLAFDFTPMERYEWMEQLKTDVDGNGFSVFKKFSPLNKEWMEKSKGIDFDKIDDLHFWFIPYAVGGSGKLFDDGDDIYGYLECPYGHVECPEWADKISLEEFYKHTEVNKYAD